MNKLPFKDVHGRWWVYRSDDDRKTPVALGPFFTMEYAFEAAERAKSGNAPLPLVLSHDRPGKPDMSTWLMKEVKQRANIRNKRARYDGIPR